MTKELLDLYSDYLLSSMGATTATGLSRLLDGAVSHDQITRFLSDKVKTSSDLWRVVKAQVRRIESEPLCAYNGLDSSTTGKRF